MLIWTLNVRSTTNVHFSFRPLVSTYSFVFRTICLLFSGFNSVEACFGHHKLSSYWKKRSIVQFTISSDQSIPHNFTQNAIFYPDRCKFFNNNFHLSFAKNEACFAVLTQFLPHKAFLSQVLLKVFLQWSFFTTLVCALHTNETAMSFVFLKEKRQNKNKAFKL